MGYDNVIAHVGNFGRHQRRVLPVLLLPAIACAFHKMGGAFLAAKADFRCLLPNENPENATYQLTPDATNLTYLWNGETNMWPQCEIHNPDIVDPDRLTEDNVTSTFSTVKCDSFVYDKTHYIQTVTTEWNFVCDNAWLKSMSESLFLLGDIPGSIIFGQISDRYGRKTALLWNGIMNLIFGSLLAVSPNSSAYMALRALVGATTSSQLIIVYVTALEMVSPQNRTITGVVVNLAFSTGYILSACLAYLTRTWRYLQIAFTIPTVIFLVLAWSVPESARWLMTNGRVQKAKVIIENISTENGIRLPHGTLDGLLMNDADSKLTVKRTTMFDLLRSRNLRNKSLLLFFMWFVIHTAYVGLSWNTSNLGGNDYVNFGIAGAVEVPAYLFLLFTSNKCGRKVILCGSMLLTAISLLVTFFIPTGMTWVLILFAMIGKFAITLSFGMAFIFTAEQYPTANRNIGLACCAGFGKLGAALVPFINNLSEISTYLPLVVFGSASLVAGLSSLVLPETLNKKLPESIQDAEGLGRNTETAERGIKRFDDAVGT